MTELHAQPYNIDAIGFYFDSVEDYRAKAAGLTDSYGEPVEEFEIQFIDGDDIDCDLFKAIGVYQNNIGQFFEAVENWDEDEKTRVIIACNECGYKIDRDTQPDDFDLDIYELDTLKELAEQFVDEGLFGEIPENLRNYLDMDAIAYDLGMDYSETRIAGRNLIYRCG